MDEFITALVDRGYFLAIAAILAAGVLWKQNRELVDRLEKRTADFIELGKDNVHALSANTDAIKQLSDRIDRQIKPQ